MDWERWRGHQTTRHRGLLHCPLHPKLGEPAIGFTNNNSDVLPCSSAARFFGGSQRESAEWGGVGSEIVEERRRGEGSAG